MSFGSEDDALPKARLYGEGLELCRKENVKPPTLGNL